MDTADRIAIHELVNRYATALDEHSFDVLEACFASTAIFRIAIAGQESMEPFVGREAIMQLFRDSAAAQSDRRRHVISNVFVDAESGDGVAVTSNLTLFSIANSSVSVLTTGVYRDKLVLENGAWKILDRDLRLDLPY